MKSAAVFDYEGTVGEEATAWIDIEKAFGVDLGSAVDRFKSYSKGEQTWSEYQEERIGYWNSNLNGEDARDVFEDAIRDHFNKNGILREADWLVDFLHGQDFETYLISHAPDAYSQIGQRESGIQNHVETVEVKADGIVEDIMKKENYCKEEFVSGLQRDGYEVWFFGNGDNDFEAAERADHGYIITNTDTDYSDVDAYKGSLEDVCSQVSRQFRGEEA